MDGPHEMQPARAEAVRLTYDDFARFPDDGRRHEVIDGEHIVTPAPVLRHQELSIRLATALSVHLRNHPLGKVYTAPVDVELSNHDIVEPDLVFVSNGRRAILRDRVHGAPDLVIEILSPSSRRTDEVTKRHLYERFGVPEYWVVDPEVEIVKVYRRAGTCEADPSRAGRFDRAIELRHENDDVLVTPLLPGFSMRLRDLFAE